MKEVKIEQKEDGSPIFRDNEGNEYSYIGDLAGDDFLEMLENLDTILGIKYNIELIVGDCGSSDIFVHIKQRS